MNSQLLYFSQQNQMLIEEVQMGLLTYVEIIGALILFAIFFCQFRGYKNRNKKG
jgi:uncharacterized membrane protein